MILSVVPYILFSTYSIYYLVIVIVADSREERGVFLLGHLMEGGRRGEIKLYKGLYTSCPFKKKKKKLTVGVTIITNI